MRDVPTCCLLCRLVTVIFLPPMVYWPQHSQVPPSQPSRKILPLLMSGSSQRGSSSRMAQPLVTQLFPLQQRLYFRGHILSRGDNGSVTHNFPLNLRRLCPQSCSPYCPVISFPHSQISPWGSSYLFLERPVLRTIYLYVWLGWAQFHALEKFMMIKKHLECVT